MSGPRVSGFTLRDYQERAVSAVRAALDEGRDPCVELPTGAGKSITIAASIADHERVVVAVPSRELVEQNVAAIRAVLGGDADVGVCCAGLGRHDTSNRIVVGTAATLKNHVDQLGHRDVVHVDEGHRMPPLERSAARR
ncbi:MAG: DEAD/DEAH box helicase family protein [Planctomycetota bacterium]